MRHMTDIIMCANKKKALYKLRRHPWDNTYMMRLMKILTFATRLKTKDQ